MSQATLTQNQLAMSFDAYRRYIELMQASQPDPKFRTVMPVMFDPGQVSCDPKNKGLKGVDDLFGGKKFTKDTEHHKLFTPKQRRLIFEQMDTSVLQAFTPWRYPDPRIERRPGHRLNGIRLPFRGLDGAYHEIEVEENLSDQEIEMVRQVQMLGDHSGWLLDYLFLNENRMVGRWMYWRDMKRSGKLSKEPIPQIAWAREPNDRAIAHLKHCLDMLDSDWNQSRDSRRRVLNYFFDWMLWSLGHSLQPDFPQSPWNEQAHNILYQVFNAAWLYREPYDYFGWMLENWGADAFDIEPQMSMGDAIDTIDSIFPDPWCDSKQKPAGAKAAGFAAKPTTDYRNQPLVDAKTGSGRLLLAASNYSLIGLGFNTESMLSKAYILSAYFYVPWAIYPFSFMLKNWSDQDLLDCYGRTLELCRAKNLDFTYFTETEPAIDADLYQPVQLRQSVSDFLEIDVTL